MAVIRLLRAEGAPLRQFSQWGAVPTAGAVISRDRGVILTDAWTSLTDVVVTVWSAGTVHLLTVAAVVAALALLAWLTVRRFVTRRALHPDRRIRLLVLPTETFDPTDEEVNRYAAQLARTRRTTRWLTDPSAHAVRLRLDSIGDGECAYRIEGSARAASILRQTGFDEVELRPAESAAPTVTPGMPAPHTIAESVDEPPMAPPDEPADEHTRRPRADLEEPGP